MNWIFLAVAAQFLSAIVALIDKRIVSDEKLLPRPFVYAFYTCIISGVWIVVYFISLLPLPSFIDANIPSLSGVMKPTLEVVSLALLSAYAFFLALVSMFTAFQKADASDVVPVVGATSAVASFGLGYFFLDTTLSSNFVWGILLLAAGTYLVSHFHFGIKTAFASVHAGIFFALHYITLKGLFLTTSFDDGFFWSRIAFVFFGLSLLLIPSYFDKIKTQTKSTTKQTGVLILSNKVIAGISTILILKATDLGDVAVVQALGGLQFVFILLLGIFFSIRAPKTHIAKEFHRESILRKAIFVAVITVGFLILFK